MPDEIFSLFKVLNKQVLNVSHNALQSLQSTDESSNCWRKIADCLQKLDASNNQLVALSASLCECMHLRVLDVSNNRLTALPASIAHCLRSLECLNVANNRLMALPADMHKLTQLHLLDVRANQIRTLPESLGRLEALTDLHVDVDAMQMPPTGEFALVSMIKY